MDCECVRQKLLDFDWTASERRTAADVLHHAAECRACQVALAEFDQLRTAMAIGEPAAEPADGWHAFEQRLEQKIMHTPPRRIWPPAAIAASLLLAVAGWGLYLQSGLSGRTPADRSGHPSTSTAFTAQEIADRVQVFREVSELFQGRTGWVLVGDHTSDLGIITASASGDDNVLLVRLIVSRRDVPFSTADLIVVPGQTVDLRVPAPNQTQLHYQLTASNGSAPRLQLRVGMEREDASREVLAALASDLHPEPGEVVSAGEMVAGTATYRVRIAVDRASVQGQTL